MLKKVAPPTIVLVKFFIVLPNPRIAPLGTEITFGDVNAGLIGSDNFFVLHGLCKKIIVYTVKKAYICEY